MVPQQATNVSFATSRDARTPPVSQSGAMTLGLDTSGHETLTTGNSRGASGPGGGAFPQETITTPGSNLVFVNTYDVSVTASYRTAIIAAEQDLAIHFTNSVTIRANFGFQSLSANAAASNRLFNTVTVSYDQLKSALVSHATSAADIAAANSLPVVAPANSHGSSATTGFLISAGLARVLGFEGASNDLDDSMVLSSNLNWNFDPNNRGAAGGHDAIGAIEHELSEGGLGRIGGLGYQNNTWGPEDLFRFNQLGVRDFTGGQDGAATYFSSNGTNLDFSRPWHSSVNSLGIFDGADPGDWDIAGDAFGASGTGVISPLSSTDITLMDVLGWDTTPPVVPPPPVIPPPPLGPRVPFAPQDMTNDGRADVLFRNNVTGGLAVWAFINGNQVSGGFVNIDGTPIAPDASWTVAGISDVNNDGHADIIWRNTGSNQLAVWRMNGSTQLGSAIVTQNGVPVAPDSSWTVAGVVDLNGDGAADVIWRSANGVSEWNLDGADVIGSSQFLSNGTVASPDASWSIAGFGDFNKDGFGDILWRNTSGETVLWAMNGANVVGGGDLNVDGTVVTLDASWSVAGIGDFNGDGNADILWRNTDGTLIAWLMNGASIIGSGAVTSAGVPQTPGANWNVVEIGDFGNDGKADILWRDSTTGAMAEWYMNGAQIVSSGTPNQNGVPASPDPTWVVQNKPNDLA